MFERRSLRSRGLISAGRYLPYNPRLINRARFLRRTMTKAERKLWCWFSDNSNYFRVLRQRPIDNYIVDFYCAKRNLVIEVDGDSHDTSNAKAYDEVRDEILRGYGLRILRLRNDEVLNDFEVVVQRIRDYIGV